MEVVLLRRARGTRQSQPRHHLASGTSPTRTPTTCRHPRSSLARSSRTRPPHSRSSKPWMPRSTTLLPAPDPLALRDPSPVASSTTVGSSRSPEIARRRPSSSALPPSFTAALLCLRPYRGRVRRRDRSALVRSLEGDDHPQHLRPPLADRRRPHEEGSRVDHVRVAWRAHRASRRVWDEHGRIGPPSDRRRTC